MDAVHLEKQCIECKGSGLIKKKTSFKCNNCKNKNSLWCYKCENVKFKGYYNECPICFGIGSINIDKTTKKISSK